MLISNNSERMYTYSKDTQLIIKGTGGVICKEERDSMSRGSKADIYTYSLLYLTDQNLYKTYK